MGNPDDTEQKQKFKAKCTVLIKQATIQKKQQSFEVGWSLDLRRKVLK